MSSPGSPSSRYQLEEVQGWNGLARTYRGRDPATGHLVAVKVLSPEGALQEGAAQRFQRAIGVLRGVSHPALPKVLDAGAASEKELFFVSPWIEGRLWSEVPTPPPKVLAIVLRVLEGLEALALGGLVHLNLSPENVLIDGAGRPHLLGWSTSLVLGIQRGVPLPPGRTNAFTAPELRDGSAIGSAAWRADLFSIASITASQLGAAFDVEEGRLVIRFDEDVASQIQRPEELRTLLNRCLASDPEKRPSSYTELGRVLQHSVPRERRPRVGDTQPVPTKPPAFGGDGDFAATRTMERVERPAAGVFRRRGESPTAPALGSDRTQWLSRDAIDQAMAEAGAEATPEPPPTEAPLDEDEIEAALSRLGPVEAEAGTEPGPPLASEGRASRRSAKVVLGRHGGVGRSEPEREGDEEETAARTAEPAVSVDAPAAAPDDERESRPEVGVTVYVPDVAAKTRAAAATETGAAPSGGRSPAPGDAPPSTPPERPGAEFSEPRVPLDRRFVLVAASLLAVVLLATWWLSRGGDEAPTARPELEPAPASAAQSPPRTDGELAPRFPERAEAVLAAWEEGRLAEARDGIRGLLDEPEAEWDEATCAALRSAHETLVLQLAAEVTGELARAQRVYDVVALRRELSRVTESERAVFDPEQRRTVEVAETTVERVRSFEQALDSGRHFEALRLAERLESETPELAIRIDAMRRAADGVETAIALLVEAGRMSEARERITEVRDRIPEADRLDRLNRRVDQILRDRRQAVRLVERAEEAGRRERPHEGLALLSQADVPARFQRRAEQLRETLEIQLRDLDRNPPTVELLGTEELEVRKDQPVVIEFRASDDYEVSGVTLRARAEGSSFREIPVQRGDGDRYRSVVSPAFHGGRPFEFWLAVRDRSGNVAQVAGAEDPVQVKRVPWYRRAFGRGDGP